VRRGLTLLEVVLALSLLGGSQKALKEGYRRCPIKSINAGHLDDLVRAVVLDHLDEAHGIDLRGLEAESRDHWIREAVHRVILAPEAMTIELEPACVEACREASTCSAEGACEIDSRTGPTAADRDAMPKCLFAPDVEECNERTVLTLHIKIKRHDNRRIIVAPDGRDLFVTFSPDGAPIPQEHLVGALGQAFAWHREVTGNGATMESLAQSAGVTPRRVAHLLALTRLSPTIVRSILTGQLGTSISLQDLRRAAEHIDWSLQAASLMLDWPEPGSC